MAVKTDTEVIIGGKVLTLSGYESEEYLQRVASYINNKLTEYSKLDGFTRQTPDRQNILMQLNIADDYFKAKRQAEMYEEELEAKDMEMYDLKHDLINGQVELDKVKKIVHDKDGEILELQKKAEELEKELEELLK